MAKRKRDEGNEETEALLNRLEKRIQAEYSQAATEVEAKFKDYMRRFEIKDKIKRQAAEAGIITEADYQAWRTHQILMGERWQAMLDDLATDLVNTDQLALSTARGYQEEAYAINHGYATYVIESESGINTAYTLYDRQTVERLIREDPKLLPDPRPGGKTAQILAENKALRWNRQKLSSAITQGITQGESIPQITRRLESVVDMDHRAAIRNARTMVTGAQNAGRIDAGKRAKDMGVDTTNVWMATLDMRTRHEHRLLDGQRREVGEPFVVPDTKEEIRFPGDPEAAPYLVYNCRCTLIPQVKGFEYDIRGDAETDFTGIEGMTYEEWKEDRTEKPNRITRPEERQNEAKGEYIKEYEALRKKLDEVNAPSEPEKPAFVPAKTREEAEAYAQSILADHVDYSGMSVDRANEINRALHDLTAQYPVRRLDDIGTHPPRNGVASGSHSALQFNPKKLGKTLEADEANFLRMRAETDDMIRLYEERFAGKKIPPAIQARIDALRRKLPYTRWGVQSSYDDHVYALVAHEYGHMLSDQYFGMINEERANPHYGQDWRLRDMRNRWRQAYDRTCESGDIYQLSQYGATNDKEFFAECFAAHVMGEQLPDYVESLLMEVLTGGIM